MRIFIDASNLGSGGGIVHLVEIIRHSEFSLFNSGDVIYILGSEKLLVKIPQLPWVEKISHRFLNRNKFFRLYFQLFYLDKLLAEKADILFSITGDYLGSFSPVIGMSQNMLFYDEHNLKDIKSWKQKLRFYILKRIQIRCFNNSSGLIFLSEFAKMKILGNLRSRPNINFAIIHHGVSDLFFVGDKEQRAITTYSKERPFSFVYVSTVHVYKHQWNVVEAFSIIRKMGYPIVLSLIGGSIDEDSEKRLRTSIEKFDNEKLFVKWFGNVNFEDIPSVYFECDGIIYASSCENMPNILIESMKSSRPIVCSEIAPMPEFLEQAGFYFDPRNVDSIVSALKDFLESYSKRQVNVELANNLVRKYNWRNASQKTFNYIKSFSDK